MPIEELLAAYRRQYSSPEQSRSSSEEEILSNQDLTLDKEQIGELIIIANFDGTISVFFPFLYNNNMGAYIALLK